MKIFIPYKTTKDDGLECRYVIRSMVKHFKDLSGCVIAGDKPTWYKNGLFLPASNIEDRKEYTIYRKLRLVNEPVLHLNDDFFALQDFDATLPNYYFGTCGEKNPTDKVYKELYWNCPPHWLNFDVHCPMVIDPYKFTEWFIDRPLKTYYGNLNKLQGVEMADCKIRGTAYYYGEIKMMIQGRKFFSTTDNLKADLLKVVQDLYPEPSIYENTEVSY